MAGKVAHVPCQRRAGGVLGGNFIKRPPASNATLNCPSIQFDTQIPPFSPKTPKRMHFTLILLGALAAVSGQTPQTTDPDILKAVDFMNQALDQSLKSLSSSVPPDERSEMIQSVQSLQSELEKEAPSILQKNLEAYRHALENGHRTPPKEDLNLRVVYASQSKCKRHCCLN